MSRTRRRRQRRGGKAIAVGSDGCIFDGEFAPDGTFTPTESTVTKVAVADIIEQEYAVTQRIAEITGGKGIVAARERVSIANIPKTAWDNDKLKSMTQGGCSKIQRGSPIAGLVLPKLEGTISTLNDGPPLLFDDITDAVRKMSAAGIVHMDMAQRNIFYTKEGVCLLGDFGSSMTVDDETLDANVQSYLAKYNFSGNFVAVMRTDSVHPVVMSIMLGYDAFLRGEDSYTKYVDMLKLKAYDATKVADVTWVMKTLVAHKQEDLTRFRDNLAKALLITINGFTTRDYKAMAALSGKIKSTLKRLLLSSDIRLLELIKCIRTPDYSVEALTKIWFPPVGGQRRTRRRIKRRS